MIEAIEEEALTLGHELFQADISRPMQDFEVLGQPDTEL
jgi:hypothetical protein